ncbi:glycosyltransferase, partial [Candidatus Pacearchaeota archaeon]|nr:glycosyltransferase [Candidatus Pacearchaeota archaeon]
MTNKSRLFSQEPKSTPEISVLTSCYNSGAFIKESIGSIQGQSFTEFEYVIVNDGSTDNTMSLLREYA